jgi:cytochrome c5
MKLNRLEYSIGGLAAIAAAALGFLSTHHAAAGDKGGGAAAPPAPVGKSGAQLWADNCQRCHNLRSPSSYSAAQWEVAMLHMRVRANLTPEQHQKILEFLKSSS